MTQIQIRRDTEANWTSVNPTLALGEWGYDTTNKVCKIGDGTTPWNTLSVYGGESELPIATDTTAGIVKPDGSTITVTADGTISSVSDPGGTLQTQITALQTTTAGKQNTIQEEHSGMYWYNNKMWLNLANTDSYLDVYIADTTATATTGFNQSTININMTNLKNALTGGLNVVKLTQTEYDALETKDTNTMYVVVG